MAEEYFLMVRFAQGELGRDYGGRWQEGTASREQEAHPCYRVNSKAVGEMLLELRQDEMPSREYKLVSTAELELKDDIYYRQTVDGLEEIRELGDPDPGTWVEPGGWVDDLTVLLVYEYWAIEEREPYVRGKLGLKPHIVIDTGDGGSGAQEVSSEENRDEKDPREPDENGLVQDPVDKTAYCPAKQLKGRYPELLPTHRELRRILDHHPEIRHWRPWSRRLSVHLGDWLKYVHERDGGAITPAEVERRYAQFRKEKAGK